MKQFYAVKRGYDKKKDEVVKDLIFTDWIDVKPLVVGYDNARYKGFETEEEAKTWLSVVDRVDAEKRAKKTIEQAKKEIGIEDAENVNSLEDYLIELFKMYKKDNVSAADAVGRVLLKTYSVLNKVYESEV